MFEHELISFVLDAIPHSVGRENSIHLISICQYLELRILSIHGELPSPALGPCQMEYGYRDMSAEQCYTAEALHPADFHPRRLFLNF